MRIIYKKEHLILPIDQVLESIKIHSGDLFRILIDFFVFLFVFPKNACILVFKCGISDH